MPYSTLPLCLTLPHQAPSKASHLSRRINEEIKRVATVMGSVCILGAMLTTLWNAQVKTAFRILGTTG